MWSTDALYPEEQSGSPSRFNLTVKELLLSGGGDLVGALTPAPLPQVTFLSAWDSGVQRGPGRTSLPDSPAMSCLLFRAGILSSKERGGGEATVSPEAWKQG